MQEADDGQSQASSGVGYHESLAALATAVAASKKQGVGRKDSCGLSQVDSEDALREKHDEHILDSKSGEVMVVRQASNTPLSIVYK